MNNLLAISLVLLLSVGFGSSQGNDSLPYFDFEDDCIKISMQVEVNVTYEQTDGNMSTHIVYGEDYAEDDVTTECNETAGTAFIEITWQSGTYVLTINFAADVDKHWNITSMGFQYTNADDFDDPKLLGDTLTGTVDDVKDIGWNYSYLCNISEINKFDLKDNETENGTAQVIFPIIQVQVFSFDNPGNFSEEKECEPSPTGGGGGSSSSNDDKIVPIAVGCALAGLVIIVLIAYLIGRFRSRKTDTYQVLS